MDRLTPLTTRLLSEGRPRVWSLVITVFGDSVQHRGGRIATARLGQILGRIGIESGAMRTALSRLARDGWVESLREGRTSSYTLAAKGRELTAPASARIYAAPRNAPVASWVFEVGGRGIALAGGHLRPGNAASSKASFALVGALPAAQRAHVARALPQDHLRSLETLLADLDDMDALTDPDPLEALAARTLLIHRWRRLVLRWPETPAEVLPKALAAKDPHRRVAQTYAALSPAAEAWLDSPIADQPPMPAADAGFALRFTQPTS